MDTQQLERPVAQTPARLPNQLSDASIVPYTDVKFEAIAVAEPLTQQYESLTEKDEQGNPKKGDFFIFKATYLYGPLDNPTPKRFIWRTAPVLARGGIKAKTTRTGEPSFSMMFSFDQSKQDSLENIKTISVIHYAFGWKAKDFRGKIKIPGFTPDSSELMRKTGLKFPVYYPITDNGDLIKGANPSMWIDLIPNGRNKTVFKYPSENVAKEDPIDWLDLSGDVDVLMEAEVLVSHCTATAGSMTIKFKLTGAIVLDVVPSKSEILSQDHAADLARKDPSIGSHVKQQIEMIRNLRLTTEQDAKLPSGAPAPGALNSTPSFSGVDAAKGNGAGVPNVPNVPGVPGASPAIPAISAFSGVPNLPGVPNTPFGGVPGTPFGAGMPTPGGPAMDISAFLRQGVPPTPSALTTNIPGMNIS